MITGASSGIGAATAQALAQRGAKLALGARREERLQELSQQLEGENFCQVCDVTVPAQMQALVERTLEKFGQLDGLVNNAGLGHMSPLAEAPLGDWHRMVDVNIKGFLNAIHACLPHLQKTRGHIVNLASVAAHNVYPNSVVYAGTKHFVKVISQGLRLELRDQVRVTSISPGAVETEFIEQITHPEIRAQYEKAFQDVLKPEDIGEAIANAMDADPRMVVSELIIRPNK